MMEKLGVIIIELLKGLKESLIGIYELSVTLSHWNTYIDEIRPF